MRKTTLINWPLLAVVGLLAACSDTSEPPRARTAWRPGDSVSTATVLPGFGTQLAEPGTEAQLVGGLTDDDSATAGPDGTSGHTQQVLALWRAAADMGAPDAALAELHGLSSHADRAIAELARRAVADLEQLRTARAALELESRSELGAGSAESEVAGAEPITGAAGNRAAAIGLETYLTAVDQAPRGSRQSAIQEVWRYAADTGQADAAVAALDAWSAMDTTPAESRLLERALNDLRQLAGHETLVTAPEETPAERFERAESSSERSEVLAEAGGLPDAEAMSLAVGATQDPAQSVRTEAIQLLWRMGADQRGDRPEVMGALEHAASDTDLRVARMARNALDDLRRLDESRQYEQMH